jgi:hypothetical protein
LLGVFLCGWLSLPSFLYPAFFTQLSLPSFLYPAFFTQLSTQLFYPAFFAQFCLTATRAG